MNRLFLPLILLAALLLPAAGCSGETAKPAIPAFSENDLLLCINETDYSCNINIDQVISGLGEGYRYAEGQSCDYDGLDKSFIYDVAEFYTSPLALGDTVNEIYTTSPGAATSRGITVGASREDILAAYGPATDDEGDMLIYRLENDRTVLCFELDDNEVWAIYLTIQSV